MNRFVITHNAIEGFHHYKDAPEFCSYLSNNHRHIFDIRCKFVVSHNDREIEINEQQRRIKNFLKKKFGTPCNFLGMSCESIAEVLMQQFDATSVEVLEDGYGGAEITT